MTARPVRCFAAVAVLLCVGASAQAQGFAIRGGANVNPDQFFAGAEYVLGPLTENIWLQPGADLGQGDGATLLSVNLDVTYRKRLQRNGEWSGYLGGGPAIHSFHLDTHRVTDLGIGVLGGVMHRSGIFADFRIGFLASPQFRAGVGYAFRRASRQAPRRR